MKHTLLLASLALAGVVIADEPAAKAAAPAAPAAAQAPAVKRPPRPQRPMGPMMNPMMDPARDPLLRSVVRPEIAKAIGLSDAQIDQIKALGKASKDKSKALNDQVRAAMRRQFDLVQAEKIDEAAVMASIDELFEARKALAKEQTKLLIAVRGMLTPEQIAKAGEAMKTLRNRRPGPRMHGKPGPRPNGAKPAAKPAEAKPAEAAKPAAK